jgi:hypothetical protein
LISRPNSHPAAPNTSDWNALKIVIRFFQIESEVSAVTIMSTPMATNTTSSSAATTSCHCQGTMFAVGRRDDRDGSGCGSVICSDLRDRADRSS